MKWRAYRRIKSNKFWGRFSKISASNEMMFRRIQPIKFWGRFSKIIASNEMVYRRMKSNKFLGRFSKIRASNKMVYRRINQTSSEGDSQKLRQVTKHPQEFIYMMWEFWLKTDNNNMKGTWQAQESICRPVRTLLYRLP